MADALLKQLIVSIGLLLLPKATYILYASLYSYEYFTCYMSLITLIIFTNNKL